MRTLIVSGGRIDPDFALSFCKSTVFENVIGVDSGLEFLFDYGISPTHWRNIIGEKVGLNFGILTRKKTLRIPRLPLNWLWN